MKKIIITLLLSFLIFGSFLQTNAGGNILHFKAQKIINNFVKKIEKNNSKKEDQIKIYNNIAEAIFKIINKGKLKGKQLELINFLLIELNKKINILDEYYYDLSGKEFMGGEIVPYFDIKIHGNRLSFQKKLNGEIFNYIVTATKFGNEITFDTADGPYFVLKEKKCNMAMGGFPYYYAAYVYEGGAETFAGCASPKRDFGNKKFSGNGKNNSWSLKYKDGKIDWLLGIPGEITQNYDVQIKQIGDGFVISTTDEKIILNFRPNFCTIGDTVYAWNVEGHVNGEHYTGCANEG